MNQTKKRLAIIELAISITDIETIKLQQQKLELLRSDSEIDTILTLLEEKNYAQAQGVITTYIETPTQTVIQRIPEEEQAIIDEFDFLEPKVEESENDVTLEETQNEEIHETDIKEEIKTPLPNEEKSTPESSNEVDFDTLLSIDTDEILSDNIHIDVAPEDNFTKEKIDFNLDAIPKDSFFDAISVEKVDSPHKESIAKQNNQTDNLKNKEDNPVLSNEPIIEEATLNTTKIEVYEDTKIQEVEKEIQTIGILQEELTEEKNVYPAIRNMHRKLQDLQITYPPLYNHSHYSEELEAWLEIISEDGYTESDVEDILKHIEKLAHSNKAEAAQFLLATSATQSRYAKFILARALYRGTLLKRNLTESFTIMSQLAYKDKYPEAICDLAQFYENGISVEIDKKQAKQLYKEAMELGIQRAASHYARMENETKGLFSFFKN